MVELKMNIGWMRDKVSSTIKWLRDQVEEMRQGKLSSRTDGSNDKRLSFVVSKKTRYDLVVLSGVNGDLMKLKKEQDACNAKRSECTRLMILCDGPIVSGYKINKDDKQMLDKRLRESVEMLQR